PLSENGSRQSGHRVGPGFDDRENRIVAVGGDADLVPGEGHVVGLPGGVVTPQSDRVALPLLVVHRVATHCSGHLGVCQDFALHGCEGYGRRCTNGHVSNRLSVIILVDDTGVVILPGFGDRVHSHTAHLIGSTPEGVGTDDGGYHRVERSGICKRGSQFSNGTLGDALFNKICHD
ncbi:MAG TPA: hypothetical protein PLK38_02915, partial [Methanoregulaceae archaeon]|nr:hypothetical protein [Methanoregulaceae archaeon]